MNRCCILLIVGIPVLLGIFYYFLKKRKGAPDVGDVEVTVEEEKKEEKS